jgi:Ca2+-binding RTX toxin-like protein
VLGTDFSDSITGGTGADSLVGGSGADILLGSTDGADTISGGTGADYLDAGIGNDIDSVTGGTGDDSMLVADVGAVDIFTEAASEGTLDTLLITALDVSGINVNGSAGGALNGASGLGFEQIALGAGATTFIGAQLSGLTINFTEQGTVTSNIIVTATANGTTNLVQTLSQSTVQTPLPRF